MCILKDVIIIIEINDSYYQNLFPKNSLYSYATLVTATPVNAKVYKKVILVNIDSFNHFKVKEPIIPFGTKYEELENMIYIHRIMLSLKILQTPTII